MRYLGVDYGGVRTGLSLSDATGLICRPLCVIKQRDADALIESVLAHAAREEAGEIVVGLPRPLSGGTNAQLQAAEAFARRLAERTRTPVVTCDERFTSKLAEKGRTARTPADAVAACHLLQSYLDALYAQSERETRLG